MPTQTWAGNSVYEPSADSSSSPQGWGHRPPPQRSKGQTHPGPEMSVVRRGEVRESRAGPCHPCGDRVSPATKAEGTAGLATPSWRLSILLPPWCCSQDPTLQALGTQRKCPPLSCTLVSPCSPGWAPCCLVPRLPRPLAVGDARQGWEGGWQALSSLCQHSCPHPTPHSPGDALGACAHRASWSRGGAGSPRSLLRKADAFPK